MTNLVLNTLTYTGAGVTNQVAQWWNRVSGFAAGFSLADLSLRFSTEKWRGKGRLTLPTLVEEDSSCGCEGQVHDTSDVEFSFRIDPKASPATRLDLYLRFKDFVSSTQVRAMFENLEYPTG